MVSQWCCNFIRHISGSYKDVIGDRSEYIFYKIVDSIDDINHVLQCINTKATFRSNLIDIVFDSAILYGLHPIQACYIGIRYAEFSRKTLGLAKSEIKMKKYFVESPISRYGLYTIMYQTRAGKISFINKKTEEEVLMSPRDIALSENLIQGFDASQAFYIGFLAKLKPLKLVKQADEHLKKKAFPHLRLV